MAWIFKIFKVEKDYDSSVENGAYSFTLLYIINQFLHGESTRIFRRFSATVLGCIELSGYAVTVTGLNSYPYKHVEYLGNECNMRCPTRMETWVKAKGEEFSV